MKFRLIDASKAELPIGRMCDLLQVSPSGYYAWKKRKPSRRQLDDMIYLAHIREHFALSNETYGYPRMHVELVEQGLCIGKHRPFRHCFASVCRAAVAHLPLGGITACRTVYAR